MRLCEAARALHAHAMGVDVLFRGVSTDTRQLESGQLFVALRGPNFDGHEFLESAREGGAAAAMVDAEPIVEILPALRVKDTRVALGELAAHWRQRFSLPLVGVTGSNGKTTVKEMLASIFAIEGEVLATRGNLNNDVGLPLTLLRLGEEHRMAVVELGANHVGEIAYLAGLARPTVGVITQCNPAHLEGFGSVRAVARTKGELFQALPSDGVAVINADDPYAGFWRKLAGERQQVSFGLEHGADVWARWAPAGDHTRVSLQTPLGSVETSLALPGRHNVMNALAATASAIATKLSLETVAAGLAAAKPVRGRMQTRRARGGARILDDTYNANPSSLRAALEVLACFDSPRWFVFGDMRELGEESARYHRQAGEWARELGVERLFSVGTLSELSSKAFGPGARHYQNQDALLEDLRSSVSAEVNLLVKGSRGMRMERVVQALVED